MSKDNVDKVTQIMDEWYTAMGKNGISVQPKASTILGTILAKHMNDNTEDAYTRYMNTPGGEFDTFWSSLSNDEKEYVESKRAEARDKFYNSRNLVDDSKTLLKG